MINKILSKLNTKSKMLFLYKPCEVLNSVYHYQNYLIIDVAFLRSDSNKN